MAIVLLRGAIQGDSAGNVSTEAMVAMGVFATLGWIAGWITDRLVRDAIEDRFRRRVEWYQEGLIQLGSNEKKSL